MATLLIHRSMTVSTLLLLLLLVTELASVLARPGHATTLETTTPASSASCEQSQVTSVISSCEAYVVGSNPQPMPGPDNACCSSLHTTPLSCLCSHAASSMAYISSLLNQQAARKVMETCGLDVPASATSKCIGMKLQN